MLWISGFCLSKPAAGVREEHTQHLSELPPLGAQQWEFIWKCSLTHLACLELRFGIALPAPAQNSAGNASNTSLFKGHKKSSMAK